MRNMQLQLRSLQDGKHFMLTALVGVTMVLAIKLPSTAVLPVRTEVHKIPAIIENLISSIYPQNTSYTNYINKPFNNSALNLGSLLGLNGHLIKDNDSLNITNKYIVSNLRQAVVIVDKPFENKDSILSNKTVQKATVIPNSDSIVASKAILPLADSAVYINKSVVKDSANDAPVIQAQEIKSKGFVPASYPHFCTLNHTLKTENPDSLYLSTSRVNEFR
jgi:hypothetical protein